MNLRRMQRTMAMLGVGAGLFACSDPPPPPPAPKPAGTVKADAPKPAATTDTAPAANAPPPFVYAYIPSGKRDPFRSPLDDLSEDKGGSPVVTSVCTTALCKWDLDQLKLVGVISGMANPIAMVEDPSGIGHMVRRNMFIGKKGGRVTQIKHDALVVTEIVRGGDGKPHPNDIPLHLTQDPNAVEAQDLLESEGAE